MPIAGRLVLENLRWSSPMMINTSSCRGDQIGLDTLHCRFVTLYVSTWRPCNDLGSNLPVAGLAVLRTSGAYRRIVDRSLAIDMVEQGLPVSTAENSIVL